MIDASSPCLLENKTWFSGMHRLPLLGNVGVWGQSKRETEADVEKEDTMIMCGMMGVKE